MIRAILDVVIVVQCPLTVRCGPSTLNVFEHRVWSKLKPLRIKFAVEAFVIVDGRGEMMARVHPRKLSHVVYRTNRFEEMISWYEAVFDAKVNSKSHALAFLTFDDEDHRFAFANLAILKPEHRTTDLSGLVGVDHIAYTYNSLTDLIENYAYLKAKGITPYWCIHHNVTVSMYYADPDGNQMEFQVETFYKKAATTPHEHGATNVSNPIGVEFDPDNWLDRLGAGAPESDFLIRRVHLPVSPIRGAFSR